MAVVNHKHITVQIFSQHSPDSEAQIYELSICCKVCSYIPNALFSDEEMDTKLLEKKRAQLISQLCAIGTAEEPHQHGGHAYRVRHLTSIR